MRGERLVFVFGAAAVISHIADHLITGVDASLQFDGVLALAVVTAVAALVYPRLRVRDQVVTSIALGASWLTGDFFVHVLPMIREGPEATDYTGLAATIGGLLLIGVGAAAERRRRADGAQPRGAAPGPGA